MKIQDTYQLIARLKQQPRHGADPLPGDLGDPAGVTLGGIVGLGGAAIDTVAAIAKLTTSVAGLNKALIISTGLEKAQAGVQALNTAYKNLVSPSLKLEKSNASLNKSFGINSVAAAGLAGKLQTIANTYGLTSEQVKQYAVNIKSMLPLMNQQTNTGTAFYEGLQKTQDILKTNLGLSDDQTNSYSEYAAAANNTADTTLMVAKRVAEAFGDNAQGDLGYFKMITGEIADAGSEIQLQYGKIPGSLESAVIKSKKFGLSLQNLQSAAMDTAETQKDRANIKSVIYSAGRKYKVDAAVVQRAAKAAEKMYAKPKPASKKVSNGSDTKPYNVRLIKPAEIIKDKSTTKKAAVKITKKSAATLTRKPKAGPTVKMTKKAGKK